ncbi:acetoacetate decarboxylase [Paraburkholderia sp. CNPSo 3274]|uniref:acetoacetate decarboxylase n=1 Tax=Paraburkholderia sp. CNPSo 3274 TaxID=2940932 RepID=UPI0020B6C8B1|nr:acetoacetate decarboxylase [Paraburkholderia sp. CNPSo 3274]MCP3710727.1 acetoacetate decarboxylase [Paraburkholderia sp. CNPSo 3274]
MTESDVKERAFAMPLTSPAFPPGPYRFVDREFLVITYRTDPEMLARVIPAPLEMTDPIVKFEFIRMPDSTGFGDYTESGQVIPVQFQGKSGSYVHAMYLDDMSPIAGGREIWGFPKKLASPQLCIEKDTIHGVLRYGQIPVAVATMGYKHRPLPHDRMLDSLSSPNYLLKIIPHVDGTVRICELVRYFCEDITIKGAWEGPAALELFHHALAPVAALPVLEVISGVHILSDLTLGLGTVIHDYLAS